MEKMGQPIRSKNLKKSGFSLVGNIWTKTSVEEGEAIIGEAPEVQPIPEAEADVRIEEPPVVVRRIEEISPEHIEPVGQLSESVIPSTVHAPTIEESVILETVAHAKGEQEQTLIENIRSVPTADIVMEDNQTEVTPEVVAPGHTADVQMEDAPAQGEPSASAPTDQFQEGIVEDVLDDDVEPTISSGGKKKSVAPRIPLLTRKAHHRSNKKRIHMHMKPVINRLNAHGEILCSLQFESTEAKEIGAVKVELQKMRSELGSMKQLMTNLSDFVRMQLSSPVPPAPTQPVLKESGPSEVIKEVGPSGPVVEESGPSGPIAEEVTRPPGPSEEEVRPSGQSVEDPVPSGPLESMAEPAGSQAPVEVLVVPPEPPVPSSLQTPPPSSPPTSFSAPPAPEPSKKPLPKHISSPTHFPTTSSSSPTSSPAIPPPPTFEAPPASSSVGPSSTGPSTGPSAPPPPTSFSSLHPPTPPSFITIISEGARVQGHIIQDIEDEFEEAILHSVLGFIKSDVLAPLLSEYERLSPSEWEKHYHLVAQQLDTLNSSLVRSGKPSLSAEEFLQLNSINLVQDPFAIWIERYKVYEPLKRELKQHKIFYPISIDKFLQHSSFGTTSLYRSSFAKDEYVNFIEAQKQLHIQRLLPDMGSSYNISWGAFKNHFEEHELQAWPIITRHASLLSPAFYISDPH
ncbi:hypothetical protein Taro_028791 [Colocasia esculenta]|uniref:Uncharacterized protein n=1 Tax=Colocasia esculenta TaxID=4460 RepID=A0A843VV86_COLES|nr:hypothetical protein [Colocasia esculenta]